MSQFRSRLTLQALDDRIVPDGTPVYPGAYPPALTAEPPTPTPTEPVAPAPAAGGDGLIPPGVDAATAAEIVKRLTAENATLQAKIDANNVQIAKNNAALPAAQAAVVLAKANVAVAQTAFDAAEMEEAAKRKAYFDANARGDGAAVTGPLKDAWDLATRAREDAGKALGLAQAQLRQAEAQVKALNDSTIRLQGENTTLTAAIAKNNALITQYSPAPTPNSNPGMGGSP